MIVQTVSLLFFFSFHFLHSIQSDNNSKTVYVLGHELFRCYVFFVFFFFSFYFLHLLQSENDSKPINVLGHKHVLGGQALIIRLGLK